MIELFIFLFVLQGDTPSEWLESCNTDFINYVMNLSERNPDIIFCKHVKTLDLNVDDIDKLGKEFDWFNYTMQTSQDFVDDWDFYQNNAIKDTLLIYPSVSMRDSLPPGTRVQISFNYTDESEIKMFDESFRMNRNYDSETPSIREYPLLIMQDEIPQVGLDIISNPNECWNGDKNNDTIHCEINDPDDPITFFILFFYVFWPFIILGVGVIITILIYKRKIKSKK